MKKKLLQMISMNAFVLWLIVMAWYCTIEVPVSQLQMKITYGEFHANLDGGTSQLFWAEGEEGYAQERSLMCNMKELDSSVTFQLPDVDLKNTSFRFDPFMNSEQFSIDKIEFYVDEELFFTMSGQTFYEEIAAYENVEWSDAEKTIIPLTNDPILYLGTGFNERIMDAWLGEIYSFDNVSTYILWILLVIWLEAGMILYVGKKAEVRHKGMRGHLVGVAVSDILLCLGASLIYGVFYLKQYFAEISLVELIYHANTQLKGANVSTFGEAIFDVISIVAGISILVGAGEWLLRKEQKQKGYPAWIISMAGICVVYAVILADNQLDIISYMKSMSQKTTLYEEKYVSADEVEITFPEQKRNLIYIFMESMEITYADEASGGAMQGNYMPELTALALENIDFSDYGVLNGAYTAVGTTFTTGGIVAQTAGTPINTLYMYNSSINEWKFGDDYLLQGAVTLGDLLDEQGYRQVFMLGSDAMFGGREPYFKGHGGYEIMDYNTAIETGKIPEDYKVWWGYEDIKLFDYAKEELLALAEGSEPFNLTLLTADTHYTDGYFCNECQSEYDEQYSNVIACSSKQVSEFVAWIKEQEFYENTTIVLAGDHLTMDSDYIAGQGVEEEQRRVYFAVINPTEGCEDSESARRYSTMDFYPTTLAALGAKIEGNRLGLGVNLFSEEQTLYEEYEQEYLDTELLKRSDYYANELLYSNGDE